MEVCIRTCLEKCSDYLSNLDVDKSDAAAAVQTVADLLKQPVSSTSDVEVTGR